MSNKKNRIRRRRKLARTFKRMMRGVLLIPGKIPPIDLRTVETSMRICEISGVLFVITLIARLSTSGVSVFTGSASIITILNIITGVIFLGLLSFIKLADYQDRLVRMEMADYIYIR